MPEYLAAMSRSGHDVAELLDIGCRVVAKSTSSAVVVLLSNRVVSIFDHDTHRAAVVSEALIADPDFGSIEPFMRAHDTGQGSLLDVRKLASAPAAPGWALAMSRAGIAWLALAPLLTQERSLGLLVTVRLRGDTRPSAREFAAQAQIASHLSTFLDNATALAQMRQSSLVVDAMPDAIIGFSKDREVILWNNGAERMYGIAEAEALGKNLEDLITTEDGPSDWPSSIPAIGLINDSTWTGRVRQRTRDGHVLHADVALASIVHKGALQGAVSINRDVSGLVEVEAMRADDERRMQALLDASRAMTAVFDREGNILAVNAEWARSIAFANMATGEVGVGSDYLASLKRVVDVEPESQAARDAAKIHHGISGILAGHFSDFECDYDIETEDGIRSFMVSLAPMPGEQGGAFATHTDITARRHMERQFAHAATHDALTGLRNRRQVEVELAELLNRGAGSGLVVGVIIADLDRFTDVNDSLGHAAGDQVLVAMAERLAAFDPATVVGRLAGDEFVLIVPGLKDRTELARVAGDLVRFINAPLSLLGRSLYFGAALGTALSSDTELGSAGPALILRAADTAMSRAKARGRNSIVSFDEGLRADVDRRVRISSWLNQALEGNELSVSYQPQFRCLDGRQVGVEALLRWHHPGEGDISPAEFVGIAEDSGAIIPIGEWVLNEACRWAAPRARKAGPDFTVAVNLSPLQLVDAGLLDMVRSALLQARLPASALTLEVTEGALIEDPEGATEALARLRALGVRISIDDFGTGYSSLAYLAKFPVDELKVDRAFVRDIERDVRTRALAEGIVRIGHALGMRVLAEGVETPGQLRILSGAGCDCYQGFLASPAEAPDVAALRLVDWGIGRDISSEAALEAGRAFEVG